MEKELDPVIAAQIKALYEQCQMKGYAVVIAAENSNDRKASTCRIYGDIQSLTDCITVSMHTVYDSLTGNDGLQNFYHKIIVKTAKYMPDVWRKFHKKA